MAWERDAAGWRPIEATGAVGTVGGFVTSIAYDPVARRVMAAGTGLGLSSHGWEGVPDASCASGRDLDGDALGGCADPDRWSVGKPACQAPTICAGPSPTCGERSCSLIEDCRTCPGDGGTCAARCGDAHCDAPEDLASCPDDSAS